MKAQAFIPPAPPLIARAGDGMVARMEHWNRGIALLFIAGIGLEGCTAASAPVATATTPINAAPLPSNLALVIPDRVYTGALPPPSGEAPASMPSSGPARSKEASSPPLPAQPARPVAGQGWSGLVRRVAGVATNGTSASVLLDRSSTAERPSWLPCGTKPQAVLVALDAIRAADPSRVDPVAREDLDAIRALDYPIVYVTTRPAAEVAREQALLSEAGLAGAVLGQTLFVGTPGHQGALRAVVGARYCIIALLGVQADDFPNAILPDTPGASPGWFLAPLRLR